MQLQSQKDFTQSPIFLIAPFFFLGTAMVVMKFVIPNTTPLFLAAFRLLPAGVLILLVAAVLKLPQPKTWQAWLWISIFALVDGAMFQGFLTEGLVNTGAGLGAVLIDAQPLVVALLSRFLFSELIGLWGWLGLAIGMAGICLCGLPADWIYGLLHNIGISLPFATQTVLQAGEQVIESQPIVASGFNWQNLLNSGEFLMLLAALAMSFGTIIVRYVKQHADPIVATGWHMILGGVPLMVLSFLQENNQITHLDSGSWLGLGYATIFGTAITYGIFFYLAAVGNITSVSALIFLTPVFALLFSGFLLGEQLTELQWIGVVFTLISVYLVNQREQIARMVAGKSSGMVSEMNVSEPEA
ncbi:DMT family transporter [Oscillatoria sp. FACHB-1407]|uniref:DMT family transporter n=1 Tax=Oscillatoria sp. FACHB-1407 TaxID=2692847 RepID=UPI00168503D1|nr:DMT family transporter [Oscillatoria sp. FACHB-1407]MBD2460952.1 DMT family transporter [Oscillatoria sp. FACHB-1407]